MCGPLMASVIFNASAILPPGLFNRKPTTTISSGAQMLEMRCPSVFSQNFSLKPVFFHFHEFQDSFILILIQPEAYASVSGSAISGGTASEYGVEQISNMSRFGRLP